MPTCEKCWRDSGGDYQRYTEMIVMRPVCSPEDQAGGDAASVCPDCGRKAVHVHCKICMACGKPIVCKPHGSNHD